MTSLQIISRAAKAAIAIATDPSFSPELRENAADAAYTDARLAARLAFRQSPHLRPQGNVNAVALAGALRLTNQRFLDKFMAETTWRTHMNGLWAKADALGLRQDVINELERGRVA